MHATDSSWEDIDLTASLGADAGDVAGVYFWVDFTGASIDFGLRKNGESGVTMVGRGSNNSAIMAAAALDTGDILEAYSTDASSTGLYPLFYWLNSEAEFLAVPQDVTPGSTGWQSVALGSYFTGTVQAAILLFVNTNGALRLWGCQDVGGPDRYGYAPETYGYEVGVAPCTSESCEVYLNSLTATKVYCIGAIIDGFTKFTDSYDITAANTWEEDISLSGKASAGDKAFIYHYHDGVGEDLDLSTRCLIRTAGQTWDHYGLFHGRRAVPRIGGLNDSSLTFDIKAEDAAVDLYMHGSFGDAAAAAGVAPLAAAYYQMLRGRA
jgi:hypothetical protein